MPIPILFTIPNFITAGSGQVLANIAQRLDRKRFSPTVCVMKTGGALEGRLEEMGIRVVERPFTVPARPYYSLLFRARRAAKAFRADRFLLWHSFHYADDYTEPLIAWFAGAKGWIYTKKAMGWGSRAWRLRSRLATRIVADNHDMPRVMFDTRPLRRKLRVIHHGIPVDEYGPSPNSSRRLRQENKIPEGSVIVGCVAHLVPVKGHPTLIEAIARVPDVYLLVAGRPLDEEYAAQLRRQVEERALGDRVHFLGGVSDIPAFWSEVDIGVLPTWAKWRMEGCPVALLEMMACGRPCIATDIPGARDIIVNGQSGMLVPPEDPDSLAAALRTLSDSPQMRQSLGTAARARAVEHFSIEKEVAAHEELYAESLGLD